MIPSYFEFLNPVKILSGRLAVDNIPYELDNLGVKTPLVITDPGVVQAGLLDVVVSGFSGQDSQIAAVYDQTPPDSSMDTVREAAKMYRDNNCDCLIAVGGGSVMDTAKSVNVLVTLGGDDLLEHSGAEGLKTPLKPLIAVPTTSGTGSEVTLVAIIAHKEKNVKVAMTSPHLLPRVAVLDPRMTLTMPPRITAATGMDALTHAVEAYSCLQKNPLSDGYAYASIELIRDYLIPAVEDGKKEEHRMAMANAALLAGIAFSNSMVGMVHSLAHAVGGVAHVPHGVANAILLPWVMEYNMEKVGDLYGELLLPLAGPDTFASTPKQDRASKSVAVIRDFNKKLTQLCNLPITLKDAGVPRNQLDEIAKAAINDGSLTFNPEDMDLDQAREVLEKAFG
jgi:alcohol dehydrogenase